MATFEFNKDTIGQHIVQYGVDVRPALSLKSDRQKLLDYCQWLTDEFPEVFETVLSGPNRLQIQKAFPASRNKRVELPTFVVTERGPVYTFPVRVLVEEIEDLDLPKKDDIFAKVLKEFRKRFPEKRVPRVGVVNDMVFDCGSVNATDILADALSKEAWKRELATVKIHLENPRDGNNVNLDVSPVVMQQVQPDVVGSTRQNVGFGINVRLDINNQDTTGDLNDTDVSGIIGFAKDYFSDELLKFLNNETVL